jgi:lipoyl(octanoyl) transferase
MVIHVLHLGRVDYTTASELQRALQELRKSESIGNTLLLLEHPPVITLGRNAKLAHVLAPPEFLAQRGVELHEIDRGGDVTFHGPGQLVAYPIFDLRSFDPKVGAVEYVRKLEEVLIRTCGDYGIGTQRISGLTGVWTYALRNKPEAKIAAIGVHISRGVTTHGFALNATTDLDYFSLILPCGIVGRPVTSIERETGKQPPLEEVAVAASRNFGRVFNSQMLWLESLDDLLASVTQPVQARMPAETGTETTGDEVRSRPAEPPANQDVPARPPKKLRDLHGDGSELA